MRNTDWIKDLVESERKMEETGMIDLSSGIDDSRRLANMTQDFLREIKDLFIEYSSAFNNMKNAPLGAVKIYGISNTPADFMLFRNGFKLLFTALAPGRIGIGFHHQGAQAPMGASASAASPSTDGIIEAVFGAFGEVNWTYNSARVNPEALVRYYMTRFVKESAK